MLSLIGAGEFVPFLGGNEFIFVLLDPLEVLAAVEESAVREAVCHPVILVDFL